MQSICRHLHKTSRTSHALAEEQLGRVNVPVLIVMGAMDPDWPVPRAAAQWIAGQLQGKAPMVPSAGHYPQAEFPEIVSPAVVAFALQVSSAVCRIGAHLKM
jgi:pimeloyl-ACP methyl ester carboxylesterase